MKEREYDRKNAIKYAKKWAFDRNPKYYNFDNVGGDCTSFVSQCIYQGCNIMNYNQNGWFYKNGNNKSPSWSGVEFLYDFLLNNKGVGPYGIETRMNEIKLGDLIQLNFDGEKFGHSLIAVKIKSPVKLDNIFIAAHTYDSYNKPISEYNFQKVRFIHIEKVRFW